jgi:hypothetical protein
MEWLDKNKWIIVLYKKGIKYKLQLD